MTIRVLQVISHLGHGGAEQQISLLAHHLPRDEFELHVCTLSSCPSQRRILEQVGVPVTLIGNRARVSPLQLWELSRHIKRISPHVVQIWCESTNWQGRLAAIYFRVPWLLASCSSIEEEDVAARDTPFLVDPGSKESGYVIRLMSAAGQLAIPLGVEGGLTHSRSERNVLLRDTEIPSGSRVIVACSNYTPKSRFQDVIWVADLLKVVHDDTHLVLLGDGPLRWRGQRFCQQVEIMDRVHLVAECCKLDRWLAYANFFWEADGLQASASFTMRAMASGVPVIAVDTPANRALLGRDGGLYFQLGHRAGLARQTESILNDDALAHGLSDRARQRVADRFSINRMVESHVQLYRELAA